MFFNSSIFASKETLAAGSVESLICSRRDLISLRAFTIASSMPAIFASNLAASLLLRIRSTPPSGLSDQLLDALAPSIAVFTRVARYRFLARPQGLPPIAR